MGHGHFSTSRPRKYPDRVAGNVPTTVPITYPAQGEMGGKWGRGGGWEEMGGNGGGGMGGNGGKWGEMEKKLPPVFPHLPPSSLHCAAQFASPTPNPPP